jgi:hypothetical protein
MCYNNCRKRKEVTKMTKLILILDTNLIAGVNCSLTELLQADVVDYFQEDLTTEERKEYD